jgi:polyisoprenoid-binding protein YceI
MKKIITKPMALFFLLATGLMAAKPAGDTVRLKLKAQNGSMQVAGTSSLHDWIEKSDNGSGEATFSFNDDKLADLASLSFSVPARSLKSEHKTMDNNTYKALKADKSPNITFVAGTGSVTPIDANTYSIKAFGRLTIAGNTRETEVVATGKLNADKSISVSGSKKFKMSEYGIKPPTAMFGTIKTGDDLTISYNLKFTK